MTFADLQTYVLERLSIPATDTAKVTQVKSVLNTEYLRICAQEALSIGRAELAVTEDDPLIDLPDDWVAILSVRMGRRRCARSCGPSSSTSRPRPRR